jgi:YesN/AraC family two-component response regulator
VKEYLDIVRFRKALNMYQTIEKKPLLTSIALENGYYDQSEFIKHFKKVTGYNPKKLFKNIQHLGNEDTFWTLIENK